MRTLERNLTIVTGIACLLLIIILVTPLPKGRQFIVISSPGPEGFGGQPGASVELTGKAERSDGCTVSVQDGEYTIADGAFRGELAVPMLASEELVWLDVVCEDEVRERFAREVVVRDRGHGRDRVEVAAVHLDNEVLEELLSELLPPLVNPLIQEWLDDLVQGYGEPALYPGAKIEIRSARARLRESSLYLLLEADVDLHFKDYLGVLYIQSAGLVFSCRVLALPGGVIDVSNVALNGSLCDAYLTDNPLADAAIRAVCNAIQQLFQPQLEQELARILSVQSTLWFQSIDTKRLVGDSITEWAERMHINRRLAKRLDEADFQVMGLELPEAESLSFVVTVSRQWLQRDPIGPLRIEDTDEPIDVAISVAFVNRILGVAFDRPLERVLVDLAAIGEGFGFSEEVRLAKQRIEELENPPAVPERDSMAAWLDELGLRFVTDGKLVPKLRVVAEDVLSVYVSQARFLRSTEPGERVDLGLSAEGRIEIRKVGDSHLFDLDRPYFFDHFTLEPLPADDETLSDEERIKRAALSRFIRSQVMGEDQELGEASRGRWELFREALTAVPQLPGELKIGAMTVRVGEIRALYDPQAMALSGSLLLRLDREVGQPP